jgi:hypothetical protein
MHDDEGEDNSKIIVILGNKFTSPWYGFAPKDAILPLKPPSPTRTKSSVPSLKQFSEVKSAEDFKNLSRNSLKEDIDKIALLPNGHLFHPKLYLTCVNARTAKPEDIAFKIIAEADRGYRDDGNDEDDDAEDFDDLLSMKHAQQIISFLWALTRSAGKGVPLSTPDLSEATVKLCEDTILDENVLVKLAQKAIDRADHGDDHSAKTSPRRARSRLPSPDRSRSHRSDHSSPIRQSTYGRSRSRNEHRKESSSPNRKERTVT